MSDWERHNRDALRRAEAAYLTPPDPEWNDLDVTEEEFAEKRIEILLENVRDTTGSWMDSFIHQPGVDVLQEKVSQYLADGGEHLLPDIARLVIALVRAECTPDDDDVTCALFDERM